MLLADEVHQCPVTRQWFSRTIPVTWAAAPLVWVTQGGVPTEIPGGPGPAQVRELLEARKFKVRGMRILQSEVLPVTAFLADVSVLFGLRKRHLLGLAITGPNVRILDHLDVGLLEADRWKSVGHTTS